MSEELNGKVHFWQVYLTLPPDSNNRYTRNKTVGVAAKDMWSIMSMMLKAYPDAFIYSIQHRGKIDYSQFHIPISLDEENKL